jgi:hypothetical protein
VIFEGPLMKFHAGFNSNFYENNCKLTFKSFKYSKNETGTKDVKIISILDIKDVV